MKSSIFKSTVLLSVLSACSVCAQEKISSTQISVKPVGAIAVSYNPGSKSEFINFGGPGVRLYYKQLSLAFHMFPSIRYFNGDVNDAKDGFRTKTPVTTLLGCGPQLAYKHLALVFPMYYSTSNNVWIMSAGLGYKF
jgi:hypothetical protein